MNHAIRLLVMLVLIVGSGCARGDTAATSNTVAQPALAATPAATSQPATTQPQPPVKVLYDLPYKDGEQLSDGERQRCKLDLYLPEGTNFPTVVWFYGGGLESGDKGRPLHRNVATALARHGIACAVVDYRLSPGVKFPAYVDDAAAGVAWAHRHIAEHGGDRRRIFISGHSAGGYLAAIVGFDPQYLARYGISTSKIAGLIPVSPQVFTHFTIRKERGIPNAEHTPVIDDAAPAYHARPDAPPTLIFVADRDMATRLEECGYFIAMLKAVKHPHAEMRVIADRDHGSVAGRIARDNDPALQAILQFVATHTAAE